MSGPRMSAGACRKGRSTTEVTIAEQLVIEGNEQADREQRMAAGAAE